jgi:hypothetical protein
MRRSVKTAATLAPRFWRFLKPEAVAALTLRREISEVSLPGDSVRESLLDFGRIRPCDAVPRPDHGCPQQRAR